MIAITRIAIIAATINFNCRKRERGMCECADTSCMKLHVFHCKIAFYWARSHGEKKLVTMGSSNCSLWCLKSGRSNPIAEQNHSYLTAGITGRIHLRSIVSFCYFNFSLTAQPKVGYSTEEAMKSSWGESHTTCISQ